LLIDPGREDPAGELEFRREVAAPVTGSARGQRTIDVLKLNDTPLLERRRQRRTYLQSWLKMLGISTVRRRLSAEERRLAIIVVGHVIDAADDAGEYAAMTRATLRQVTPWRPRWAGPAESLFSALQADAAAGRTLQLATR
jgi:hypothetical protein